MKVKTYTPSDGDVQVNEPEGGSLEVVETIGRVKSAVAMM